MSTEAAALAKKLAEVMGLVGWIPKKGRNTFQNYDFVREVDIVDAVSEHLAARFVAVIPKVVNMHYEPTTTKAGVAGYFAVVTMSYTFIDGETGESLTCEAVGAGTDQPGDKAFYKAQTGAKKFALTQAFLIATGEDPEDEQAPKKGKEAPKAGAEKARPADSKAQAPKPATAVPRTEHGDLVQRLMDALPKDHPQKATLSSASPAKLKALAKSIGLDLSASTDPEKPEGGVSKAQPGTSTLADRAGGDTPPEGHFAHWATIAVDQFGWFPHQLLEEIQKTPEGKAITDLRWLDPSSSQAKQIVAKISKETSAA
jgi:hypothetical protein